MAKNVLTKDIIAIETKVRAVGDELSIVLPKEVVRELNLEASDKIFLVKTDNGYQLIKQDENLQKQMDIAEEIMQRYKNAFKELAKY